MGIESGKVENECTEKENIQENVGAEKVHEITTVETNAHMHMARSAEENQLSPAQKSYCRATGTREGGLK